MITIYHVVQCEYKVYVKTDSRKDAGTNDDIYVKIASQGPFLELENYGIDDFQAGRYVI